MNKSRIAVAACIFILFTAGFAYFLTLYSQLSSFTVLNHAYSFSPAVFLPVSAALLVFMILSWRLFSFQEKKLLSTAAAASFWENFLTYLPFGLFLLTPFLLKHYFTRSDLKIRMNILAVLAISGFICLKAVQGSRRPRDQGFLEKWAEKFGRWPRRRKLLALFLLAFTVYNFSTFVLVSRGISFSGDEPYYLLTTHSLLKDGDINLANNYAQQDYFSFYSRERYPRLRLGAYARIGRKGSNYIYPINLPGISVLMLPHYWLSQFFHGDALTFILKGSLSIWAVLLGIQIYLLSLELWRKEKISLFLWLLFSFTSPILFFATHLYPEIPIAFFSVYIFRKVRSKNPLSLFHYILLGFLLSLFPWFGLKYNLILGSLGLVSLYYLLNQHRARWKVAAFLAFPSLSFFLFFYFIHTVYGSFSPFSVYEGVMTPDQMQAFRESVLGIPLRMRIDSFLDYFLDQRDGLFLYSPFYLFSLLGLVEIFRRAKKEFIALVIIALPFLLNYAFFTHRQGYSPQGRILVPISWLGAILVGYFLAFNHKELFSKLFALLSGVSLLFAGILLTHPDFLYQPTTHEFTSRPGDMFAFLSNIRIFLPDFLPSFLKVNNTGYWPNYVWILALAAFALSYIFIKRKLYWKLPLIFSLFSGFLLVLFVLFTLYPRTALYPKRVFYYSSKKALAFYFPLGTKGASAKSEGKFSLTREGHLRFLFSSTKELENVRLIFGSQDGEYDLKVSCFDMPFFESQTSHEKKERLVPLPASFPYKRLYLYEINVDLKKNSPESMAMKPYFFQIAPLM